MSHFLDQRADRMNRLDALLESMGDQSGVESVLAGTDDIKANDERSADGASDLEDDDPEYHSPEEQFQNLQHLRTVELVLTQSNAYRVFGRGLKYLVHPPQTLSDAVASRDVMVLADFLSKYDTQHRATFSSSIRKLRDLGVSRRGIAALLMENAVDFIENEFCSDEDQAEWYKRLAHRLGDRFSRTENIVDLDDVGLVSRAAIAGSIPSTQSGSVLEQSGLSKSNVMKACVLQWEIPAVFLRNEKGNTQDRDIMKELSNFVVIVGSCGQFEASTCAQYAKKHFGKSGEKAIKAVASVLKHLISINATDKRGIVIVYCCKDQKLEIL
ncbi:uncharacterized protein PG986_015175 [Apiospora aurea]|uniref:Uncharacterized protein n=1 Tax=Apiospora aurea TaxID=335848 RepID=A0ABR1PRV1_9PEZI